MNIRQLKETIYHEFGHVIVYIISNKFEDIFLSKIDRFLIGYKNAVCPKENLYYYILGETNQHITESSKNIKRSISWIILQMSGCIFESHYEKRDFKNYFCNQRSCSGQKDFDNLYYFRHKSSFKIEDHDIVRIRENYIFLLNKHDIFNKTEKYLDHFLEIFDNNAYLNFDKDDIETLIDEMESFIINEELIHDYHSMISMEAKNYTQNII
ncbi:hypothetical protein U9K52_01175 [Chryseobacterium sp. MHB01]|uniref:hypothetical protein n=1 Tax=Chryseobacterium sp. MHB01 TaxID=3109433 RepID=UPI002AFEDBD5|nr:hypothetical protein [Chryseobacterium sp. MHB01]MEA1847510.1 hypothetical protein [Chryseobacterium sp. MHB01]